MSRKRTTTSSSSFSTTTPVSSLSIQNQCCIQQDGGDENDSCHLSSSMSSSDDQNLNCHYDTETETHNTHNTLHVPNVPQSSSCCPNNNNPNSKIISTPTTPHPLPLPPPLPQPIHSFHRRILPPLLTQLSSPQGKTLFRQSLLNNHAEAFYPLSEQFLNQSDPAYCGITTLIMILNAFGIDPNVRWRGGWRWYGNEDMIINNCCIEEERVKRIGISLEEYRNLGRCQGLDIVMKRPLPLSIEQKQQHDDDNVQNNEYYTLESFRDDIKLMVQNPPPYECISSSTTTTNEHTTTSNNNNNNNNHNTTTTTTTTTITTDPKTKYGFLIVSFNRTSLNQTGEGHFSPIAAYHEETDQCLVLDVARFKYSPYWVKVCDLYEATRPIDSITKKSRGWFLNYYPMTMIVGSFNNINDKVRDNTDNNVNDNRNFGGGFGGGGGRYYRGTKVIDEVQRPAEVVPIVHRGLNTDVCPVGKIKREYCEVAKK